MAAPYYGPPQPYPQQPVYRPEADSIKSMITIGGILAILVGIVWILYALVAAVFAIATFGASLICAVFCIVMAIFDFLIFVEGSQIKNMVNSGQPQQWVAAKSKTFMWAIIGIILGGFLPGLLFLIAYMKFDGLINSAQQAPGGYPPQQYGQYPPPPPPPPAYQQAPAPTEMRICPGCGRQIPVNYNVCPHCGRPATPPPPPRQ